MDLIVRQRGCRDQPAAFAGSLSYSRPSVFWQPDYKDQLMSVYTQLNFLGEPITFVSEQQLAKLRGEGDVTTPTQATHVTDATVAALQKSVQGGGKLIMGNDGNCGFDQYHRPRQAPVEIASAIQFKTSAKELDLARMLHQLLTDAGLKLNDSTGHGRSADVGCGISRRAAAGSGCWCR